MSAAAEVVIAPQSRLKISEIFRSLQGETDSAGWPTVFVRLTGCPLRCVWCDTAYAFSGGEWMEIDDILKTVRDYNTRRICVTGGEPLAQKRCYDLLTRLCDEGWYVSLETSGALPVDQVDSRVIKVMDLKAPGSGEAERNNYENLKHLQPHDQLKIIVSNREDFDWALAQIETHRLDRWDVLLSPVWENLNPTDLADWLLESGVNARMQLQLHKVLWDDEPGR